MARIAFILLAHKDPQGVIDQARRLTATGDYVSIHFDRGAPAAMFRQIRDALGDHPGVAFAPRRRRCGWGEWSLVAATLEALREAERLFPHATHFYMLSGDCMPIKSAQYAREFLDAQDRDYIECFDFFASDWIKTGIKEERLIYRHVFNERTRKRLFYASLNLQRRLGLERDLPEDLPIMIGSQWWCLRRQTVEKVLELIRQRPEIPRFFATTWIPDETFFQTLVAHVVPKKEIHARTLTFLIFSDYGMPVTFYNDHYDLLLRQDYLFARKISPEALELRERLGALWQTEGLDFPIAAEGRRLFSFLTGRGRIGRRFAPRFWEADASLGRRRRVHVIVAKKWHVAKRLTEAIRRHTDIPAVDYIFNELQANLPEMGGVASSVGKRERHRRALVKLLFDQFGTDRLVFCADPSAVSLIKDFDNDRSETRVLFIETELDADYVRGHMGRVGLVSPGAPDDLFQRLLPVVRNDLEHEADRLREAGFAHFFTMSQHADDDRNTVALANFLGVTDDRARDLVATPHLFAD
ncbi:DUF5928 domain-containing protein [Paracoccus sp. 1_MG-2023]|uniref:DUF5928 domain-containing protein n=1 Tax=unclassified Paracoccus (in: a-proteobacteria) TaxID=2688777 RepID=UPI001C099E59|nr:MULTISPECIES: DUF5928 domain-containing protein [unclassified Paracoccus (in: a-proteobacteria)]MBU2956425.1 beta-1,6-N-acetylglucosaminyltransferase [Paracoccus sp. C2R09]MDO6669841.1 DUF5928 domain-containing protein [Paracoccus sp. 1_MG-2023]